MEKRFDAIVMCSDGVTHHDPLTKFSYRHFYKSQYETLRRKIEWNVGAEDPTEIMLGFDSNEPYRNMATEVAQQLSKCADIRDVFFVGDRGQIIRIHELNGSTNEPNIIPSTYQFGYNAKSAFEYISGNDHKLVVLPDIFSASSQDFSQLLLQYTAWADWPSQDLIWGMVKKDMLTDGCNIDKRYLRVNGGLYQETVAWLATQSLSPIGATALYRARKQFVPHLQLEDTLRHPLLKSRMYTKLLLRSLTFQDISKYLSIRLRGKVTVIPVNTPSLARDADSIEDVIAINQSSAVSE